MDMRKKILQLVLLILLMFMAVPLYAQESMSSADQAKEYKVKAAFIYNFMKFVEWSNMDKGKDAGSRDSIFLSVIGDDPFDGNLSVLTKKTINDKKIVLRYFDRQVLADEQQKELFLETQVLFVCKSEVDRYGEIIKEFEGRSVLTIGDESTFAKDYGIVSFDIESGKICFDINFNIAKNNGVKINAKLLKLARKVYKD